jgi:D-inositol-3-phosphate glycosyltransferase
LAAAPRNPRLLTLGWHAPGTGFDRVLHALLSRLSEHWEVHLAGIGYQGPPLERDGYRVHRTNPQGGDSLGAYAALELMASLSPDALLVLHDIWHLRRYERLLRAPEASMARAVYVPLDGRLLDEALAEPLLRFDLVVVYCPWAREQIADAWRRLGIPAERWPRLVDLPHGLDGVFRPLPASRVELKREVFPALANPEESFVVLNASRPDIRKRLDLTLAGFARFARDKPPGVLLCLHWAVFTEQERDTVMAQAAALGIAERVRLNPLTPTGGVLSNERLNLLYNACDVGVNTSMGEGWGLVTFEHAAAGAPQVVPRHSACAGLWEGAAELVEPVRRYVPAHSLLELAEVDPEGVAAALQRLYDDPAHYERLAARGRQRASDPALSWDLIAGRWHEALAGLASDRRRDAPEPRGAAAEGGASPAGALHRLHHRFLRGDLPQQRADGHGRGLRCAGRRDAGRRDRGRSSQLDLGDHPLHGRGLQQPGADAAGLGPRRLDLAPVPDGRQPHRDADPCLQRRRLAPAVRDHRAVLGGRVVTSRSHAVAGLPYPVIWCPI